VEEKKGPAIVIVGKGAAKLEGKPIKPVEPSAQ